MAVEPSTESGSFATLRMTTKESIAFTLVILNERGPRPALLAGVEVKDLLLAPIERPARTAGLSN
jgi:hypothetical protein